MRQVQAPEGTPLTSGADVGRIGVQREEEGHRRQASKYEQEELDAPEKAAGEEGPGPKVEQGRSKKQPGGWRPVKLGCVHVAEQGNHIEHQGLEPGQAREVFPEPPRVAGRQLVCSGRQGHVSKQGRPPRAFGTSCAQTGASHVLAKCFPMAPKSDTGRS